MENFNQKKDVYQISHMLDTMFSTLPDIIIRGKLVEQTIRNILSSVRLTKQYGEKIVFTIFFDKMLTIDWNCSSGMYGTCSGQWCDVAKQLKESDIPQIVKGVSDRFLKLDYTSNVMSNDFGCQFSFAKLLNFDTMKSHEFDNWGTLKDKDLDIWLQLLDPTDDMANIEIELNENSMQLIVC